jgi:hypothetical protein
MRASPKAAVAILSAEEKLVFLKAIHNVFNISALQVTL